MRRCILWISALILCFSLCGCGTSGAVKEILNAVDNQELSKIISIYEQDILGNPEAEQALSADLSKMILTNYDNFNKGSSSYEDVQQDLNIIYEAELLDLMTMIEASLQLDNLKLSKDAYAEAEQLYESKDYDRAYQSYGKVIEEDLLYANAQTKKQASKDAYIALILKEMQVNIDQGLYKTAYDVLMTGNNRFPNETTLVDAITNVENIWVSSVLESSEALIHDAEYQQAYDTLSAAMTVLPDASVLDAPLISLIGQWKSAVLTDAQAAFGSNKDYEAAIQIIQLSGLPAEEVDEELAHYQSYAPVALTSLKYTQKGECIAVGVSGDDAKDVNGNLYNSSNILCPAGGFLGSDVANSDAEAYITYYPNQEYTSFSGILYRPYRTLSCDYTWTDETLVRFYGDGILLYEAPGFSQNTYDTVPFNLDITGVRELKIVMMGVWTEETGWIGMYSRYPRVCAGNLFLQK